MNYIEEIYKKCRQDGHLKKFETFDSFKSGFVEEASVKKFHDFLVAKNYDVIDYSEFIKQFEETNSNKNEVKSSTQTEVKNTKNEGLFGKLFSKSGKAQEVKEFYQTKDRTYVFGGKSTAKDIAIEGGSMYYIENGEYDWKNSRLAFLVSSEVEFHADLLRFDLKRQEVLYFRGDWISGPFLGKEFNGSFAGSRLECEKFMPYDRSYYNASPQTFIKGHIVGNNKSILGLPYLKTIINTNPTSFHLVQLKDGDNVYITDEDNHVFKLGITRSILSTKHNNVWFNSIGREIDFRVVVNWEDVRENYEKYNIEIGKPFNLSSILHISKIKSFTLEDPIYCSTLHDKIHLFGETIDFNKFPQLNIDKQICFDCFGVEDIKPLFEIHDSFYNGTFFTELKNIKELLNAGYVNGYGKYGQLKNIFDGNPGENIDYEKEEVKKIFDFLLKTNLLLTNARGKDNRELLLQNFKHLIFNNENDAELISNDPSLIDEIDFSKDERLGVDMKLNFAFSSKKEKEEFEKYKKDVAEGKFYLTLMQTQRLIQNGELLGYHNKLELKCLFGEQGNPEPPASEKAQNCLSYLSEVKRHLIDTVQPKEDADKLITIIKLIITDNY